MFPQDIGIRREAQPTAKLFLSAYAVNLLTQGRRSKRSAIFAKFCLV
jgi:hypothetical protein